MRNENNNNYYNSLDAFNAHYSKFIQFSIKRGKKHTVEKLYNNLLFNVAKKHKYFWKQIDKAVNNATVYLNVKVKRQGSKNIYIPIRIKKNYRTFLTYNWMLKNIRKTSGSKFHTNFINEIVQTAENKSLSIQKKNEVYKLVEENMNNIWKK